MFFFLSKALSYLAQPLVWWLALFFWAAFTRSGQRRKTLIRIGCWTLIVFSNPLLVNTVCRAWESRPVLMQNLKDTFDVGIVLGGYSNFIGLKNDSRLQFGAGANRLTDAVYLYKKGIIRKILLSGGDGEFFKTGLSEAEASKDLTLTLGVRPEDLILEVRSRNTRENAVFTKEILSAIQPASKLLLITSAYHMPRAAACFKKAGMNCAIFPAHFIGAYFRWDARSTISPDDDFLWKWKFLVKEWIGCAVYKIQGYI